MFESKVTRRAKAMPRFAPRCAPTRSAATVTGWTFGSGCITTLSAVITTTMVASMATIIRLVRGAEAKKKKARPTSTMSKSVLARGVNSGP